MHNVRVAGLVKTFGRVAAVDGLTFVARAGGILTLLGPSGCGKTTTLRLIAGLERPDAGEIRVGDRLVSSSADGLFVPPERRGMGMVFQSYAIWPHMIVFENVAFPLHHDQAEAMTLSDHIVVMNVGRIEQEGRPEDVYQRPRTRFVMDFLGRANHLPARIARGGAGWVAMVNGNGCGVPVDDAADWIEGQEVVLVLPTLFLSQWSNGRLEEAAVAAIMMTVIVLAVVLVVRRLVQGSVRATTVA